MWKKRTDNPHRKGMWSKHAKILEWEQMGVTTRPLAVPSMHTMSSMPWTVERIPSRPDISLASLVMPVFPAA
jgi:hypothetical protein